MVVGNGLIAREFLEFNDDKNVLIFASGVSDSKSDEPSSFSREINLVKNMLSAHPSSIFIYFSTTSVYDDDLKESAYVKHKLLIESIVKSHAKRYIILRLSQVLGKGGNKNNLINFLFFKIRHEEKFSLWGKATRNLIDIENVGKVVKYIVDCKMFLNKTINIASPKNIFVYDIVREIEKIVNKNAVLEVIDKGDDLYIDITPIVPIYEKLELKFNESYISDLIRKYY